MVYTPCTTMDKEVSLNSYYISIMVMDRKDSEFCEDMDKKARPRGTY